MPGPPMTWADGLVRLASHREMLGRLAAAVRTKVREEFGLKAAMDRYDHLLRALLAGSDPLGRRHVMPHAAQE